MGNEVGEEGRFASARPVANRPSLDRGANSLEKVRVHFSGCVCGGSDRLPEKFLGKFPSRRATQEQVTENPVFQEDQP